MKTEKTGKNGSGSKEEDKEGKVRKKMYNLERKGSYKKCGFWEREKNRWEWGEG